MTTMQKQVLVTTFPTSSASSKEEIVFTPGLLTEGKPRKTKARLSWLKLARFGDTKSENDCYRYDANVLAITGAEGDYDGPPPSSNELPMTMEQAAEILQEEGIQADLYTSASDGPDNPRWRLLLPFSEEFSGSTDAMRAYRKAALKHAESVLGITFARESYTLSQSYYFGEVIGKAYRTAEITGEPIDAVVNLAVAALPELTPEQNFLNGNKVKFDSDFVLAEKIEEIVSGDNYHGATVSMFGHYASHGVPLASAIVLVQELMLAHGDGSSRFQTRYDDLERCATGVYAKEGKKQEKDGLEADAMRYTFTREGIGMETFGDYIPDSVPFVIGGLLPQTSFGIAGAGGSLKSTTMLRIMIHTVLGLPIFGKEILQQGTCVFVTSEDDLATIRHRVRMMVDATGVDKAQRELLARDLIIEDVNGTIARLVEQDSKGNLRYSPLVEQMLERYKGARVSIVCFDPMVYFGPGENFVNDGPALLMNLARRVSAELKCATGYLHHTGQEAFRSGTVDMYAGRGGTAFADNARMVGIMSAPTNPKKYPMPEEVHALVASTDAQVVQLHIPKVSYAKAPDQPVWIVRDPTDPWLFHDVWGAKSDEAEAKERAEVTELETRLSILSAVWEHLKEQVSAGRFPNKTSVRENLTVKVADKKVGKQRLSDMIEVGIQYGFIVEQDLPEHEKQGARKYYLEYATDPFIGGGGLQLKGGEVDGSELGD